MDTVARKTSNCTEMVVYVALALVLGWLAYKAYEWWMEKHHKGSPTGAKEGLTVPAHHAVAAHHAAVAAHHAGHPTDPNAQALIPSAYAYFDEECSGCPCSYDEQPCHNQLNTFSTAPQLAQSSAPCCGC